MDDAGFQALLAGRERLLEAEGRHRNSLAVHRLHREALRLIYRFKDQLGLTDEQLAELAAPQGGGTPKTPEPAES